MHVPLAPPHTHAEIHPDSLLPEQSCAGCQLNHLPEVKRFLKEVVEAGTYENLPVQ